MTDSMAEVAVLGYLTVLLWCDWLAPTVTIWSDFQLFKLWHRHFGKWVHLPPLLFFPIVIVAIYVLIEAALYAFFRNVFSVGATDPDWTPSAVFFLSFFMVMFTKQWIAVYAIGGRTRFAFVNLAGMGGCALPILVIFGVYGHWQEFGCLIFYVPFWLGALYLNVQTHWLEHSGQYKSEIDKREWSRRSLDFDDKTEPHDRKQPLVVTEPELF